ncbi:MAG: polysaccharide deacetylase family protein [Chthoniobacter sp.]|nr:polysaccharide deacetylase family protein [Chthoniobacter sp.]
MIRLLSAVFLCAVSAVAASVPAKPAPAPDTAAPTPPSPKPAATASASAPIMSVPADATAPAAPGAPRITFSQCHVEGPYVALTFDDGPHGANTPRLLEMLKQRKIHATFFMVGQCVAEFPDIVKKIVAEGHEVANHSWSHPQLSGMSESGVREQLQKTHDAIIAACGVTPKIMRPPYGAFTARQRAWANGEWGYKCALWDVDPLDWKVRNAEHVKNEILKATVPGSIILSHDIHKTTVDAMPETIDGLLAKGFKFVTVSELLAMDKPLPPKPKATPAPKADPALAAKAESPAPQPATPVQKPKP